MDRTQPSLPMVAGRAGTMTHDYKRHGTTDLFAAMNVATGEVLTHCQKGHTAQDVLRFFKQIDATVPRGLSARPGTAWTDSGQAFTREDGTALNRDSVSDRFDRLVVLSALPPLRCTTCVRLRRR